MREIEYLIAMAVGSEPSYSEAQRGRYRRILLDKKLIEKWGSGRGTRVEITARGLSIVSQYQSGDRIGAIDFLLGLVDDKIVKKEVVKPMIADDVGRISKLNLSVYRETDSDIAMATRLVDAWTINTPPRLSTAINDGTRAMYIATAAKLIRREIDKNRSIEAIEAMIDNVTTTDLSGGGGSFTRWLDYVTDLDYIFVSKRSKAQLWRPRIVSSSTGSDIAKRRIAIKKMRDKIAVGQGDPYAYYRLIGFVPEDIKQQLKSKGVQHEVAKEVVERVQTEKEDAYIESGAIVSVTVNDFLSAI